MVDTATVDRVSTEVLETLAFASIASISSLLSRHGYRHIFMQGLNPLRPGKGMAGQAFTLRYIPARADLEHRQEFDNLTNKQQSQWKVWALVMSSLSTLVETLVPVRWETFGDPNQTAGSGWNCY